MYVRFHCPDRLSQHVRRLLVGELLNVSQDDRVSVLGWQSRHPNGKGVQLHFQNGVVFWADGVVRLAAIQLDEARPNPSHAITHDVQRDLVQPGLLPEVTNAVRRIRDQGAVRAQKGVLRDLFSIVTVAGEGKAECEDPVLVLLHHPFEEPLGSFHHFPNTPAAGLVAFSLPRMGNQ
jgi:hypothetical protein